MKFAAPNAVPSSEKKEKFCISSIWRFLPTQKELSSKTSLRKICSTNFSQVLMKNNSCINFCSNSNLIMKTHEWLSNKSSTLASTAILLKILILESLSTKLFQSFQSLWPGKISEKLPSLSIRDSSKSWFNFSANTLTLQAELQTSLETFVSTQMTFVTGFLKIMLILWYLRFLISCMENLTQIKQTKIQQMNWKWFFGCLQSSWEHKIQPSILPLSTMILWSSPSTCSKKEWWSRMSSWLFTN